jgi:hypothetical protein
MALQYVIYGFLAAVVLALILPRDFEVARIGIFMLAVSTGLFFGWTRRDQPPPD